MINYNKPSVELIPNPTSLDLAIQTVQLKLADLAWLEKAFGRATLQKGIYSDQESKRYARREYVYAEVYNNLEPMIILANDNLKSYCFFIAKDPMSFVDYQPRELTQMVTQPLALIVWCNLNKIDSTKKFNFIDQLRKDVVEVLKTTDFICKESSIQYDRVFDPITIQENYRPYLKPPYAAFRIDGEITFDYFQC